jgi:hypothetical protein
MCKTVAITGEAAIGRKDGSQFKASKRLSRMLRIGDAFLAEPTARAALLPRGQTDSLPPRGPGRMD